MHTNFLLALRRKLNLTRCGFLEYMILSGLRLRTHAWWKITIDLLWIFFDFVKEHFIHAPKVNFAQELTLSSIVMFTYK